MHKTRDATELDIWLALLTAPIHVLRFLGICVLCLTALGNEMKGSIEERREVHQRKIPRA